MTGLIFCTLFNNFYMESTGLLLFSQKKKKKDESKFTGQLMQWKIISFISIVLLWLIDKFHAIYNVIHPLNDKTEIILHYYLIIFI